MIWVYRPTYITCYNIPGVPHLIVIMINPVALKQELGQVLAHFQRMVQGLGGVQAGGVVVGQACLNMGDTLW